MEEVQVYIERWIDQKLERDKDAVLFYHEAFDLFLGWLRTQGKTFGLPVASQFDAVIKDNGFTKELDDREWYIVRGLKLKDCRMINELN